MNNGNKIDVLFANNDVLLFLITEKAKNNKYI